MAMSTVEFESQTHVVLQSQKEQPVWFKTYKRTLSNVSIVPNPHRLLAPQAASSPHSPTVDGTMVNTAVQIISTIDQLKKFGRMFPDGIVVFLDMKCSHCIKLYSRIQDNVTQSSALPHIAISIKSNDQFLGLDRERFRESLGFTIDAFPHAIHTNDYHTVSTSEMNKILDDYERLLRIKHHRRAASTS